MLNFNYYIPLFPGFYETVFESSDTAYYAIKEHIEWAESEGEPHLEEDAYDFDYERYEHDIALSFIETFKDIMPDWIEEITFDEIVSPAYYNFENDKLACDFTLKDNWREKCLELLDKDYVQELIKDEHASYDGFISFMSNDLDEWRKELQQEEPDERYLADMIKYAMLEENDYAELENMIYEGVVCDICAEDYVIEAEKVD